jgi:hypothetical protein
LTKGTQDAVGEPTDGATEKRYIVIPAKAGIQAFQQLIRIALDPGLRRGDSDKG